MAPDALDGAARGRGRRDRAFQLWRLSHLWQRGVRRGAGLDRGAARLLARGGPRGRGRRLDVGPPRVHEGVLVPASLETRTTHTAPAHPFPKQSEGGAHMPKDPAKQVQPPALQLGAKTGRDRAAGARAARMVWVIRGIAAAARLGSSARRARGADGAGRRVAAPPRPRDADRPRAADRRSSPDTRSPPTTRRSRASWRSAAPSRASSCRRRAAANSRGGSSRGGFATWRASAVLARGRAGFSNAAAAR